jgi:hypothetical protein
MPCRRLTCCSLLFVVAIVVLSTSAAAQSTDEPGALPTEAPSPVTGTAADPSDQAEAQPDATRPARPFGPGSAVEVLCDAPSVYLFVAKGIVDDRPAFPDPFVKVGRLPTKLELPPGVFTVLVEGEDMPSATTSFEVRDRPVSVRVKPGSQNLRDLSTLTVAIGVAAILAGGVLEISRTKDEDASTKRKITIPLFIGGSVGLAGGIGMAFASATSLEHDGFLLPKTAGLPARGVFLTGRF